MGDIAYYRRKYMEALEERLVLHTKVQERDAELRSKEDEVLGIQEQVETMAKELKSLRAQLADAQAAHHGEVHVDVSHEVKKQRRPLVEIPENSLANRDETEISSSETDQDSADESYNSASSVAAEEEESEDSDAKSAASSSSEDRPLQRKHLSRRHSPKQLRQSPRRTTFSSSPKAAIKSRLSRLAKKREIQGEAKFRRYWEIDDDDLSDERTARKRSKVVIEDSPQREQGRDRSVSRPASANRLKKKESRQSTSRDRKKEQIPEKKSQAQSAEHRGKGGSSQRQKHKTTQVKDEESTSNSDSEEEKNPNELFAWTVIIEERYTGTLACLPPKDRIELEEAFYRYLRTRQKNKEEKLHRYMANDAKGRRVVALPRKYVDDFQSWLDKEMDEGGLFQKTPKKKKIVVKTNTPRREPKLPSPLDPKLVDLLESPVAKHESLSPVRLDRAEATSMDDLFGPPSDTEMQDAVVIEREEHEIDELESPVPATLWPASPNKKGKSPVNPLEMIDEDIEGLMAESMRTILKPQSVLPSLESSVKINKNRPVIASPAKKGENVEWRQWRHVLQDRFPELDLNSLGKQHTLFTIGFLNRNKIDQRRIMSGKQSAPGIPSDFWDTFTAEFQTKFPPKALTDLNQGDIEEILEEGTSLNPVQSPELQAAVSMPASSKAAPNAVTLPEFTTVSNTSPLTGFLALESRAISPKKTVTSQVPSFEVVARQTPILIDDESDKDWTLIRYNILLEELMPNFRDLRRDTRLTMKRAVSEFLNGRLGVAGYAACTIQAKAHDTVFSTFGVPKYLVAEFKDWARAAVLPLIPVNETKASS